MEKKIKEVAITKEDVKKASEKYDVSKFAEIINQSSSPEEAFKAIHDLYPEFEIDLMKRQCECVIDELKESIMENNHASAKELSQEDLESIVGGSIFSDIGKFFKDHWKSILCISLIALSAALMCTGIGAMGVGSVEVLLLPAAVDGIPTLTAMTGFVGGLGLSVGTYGLMTGIHYLKKC